MRTALTITLMALLFCLNLFAATTFPNEDEILSRIPEQFRPYAKVIQLKNFLSPLPAPGDNGEIDYQPIRLPVIAVHKNIVLSYRDSGQYADDAADADGKPFILSMVFAIEGLNSLVTTTSNMNPIPLNMITENEREILTYTLLDLANENCTMNLPGSTSLETLSKLVNEKCASIYIEKFNK
jgi:hypothetical protein